MAANDARRSVRSAAPSRLRRTEADVAAAPGRLLTRPAQSRFDDANVLRMTPVGIGMEVGRHVQRSTIERDVGETQSALVVDEECVDPVGVAADQAIVVGSE